MNRFSIILPVKNGGSYVKECVNSILAQTFKHFNLLVLDNASTDGTLEWIRSLTDHRIIIHPSDNPLTIEENWNRIVAIPKNEFMTMIGHDDILNHHFLQEMNELIIRHPKASLYQSHYNYIDSEGKFLRPCIPMDEIQNAHEFLACQMSRTIESTGTGYVMRSADYDRVGGIPVYFPNLIFADYALWITLMLVGYKATSSSCLFYYRIHQNVSRTTNGMQYQEAFTNYIEFIKKLMTDNTSIREVVIRYGHTMLMYFCESLSHRLLKTPRRQRSLTVSQFIEKCTAFATEIIPEQEFKPLKIFKIRIAKQIDQSAISRNVFNIIKKCFS